MEHDSRYSIGQSGYKNGCRCKPCKDSQSERMKAYRADRKRPRSGRTAPRRSAAPRAPENRSPGRTEPATHPSERVTSSQVSPPRTEPAERATERATGAALAEPGDQEPEAQEPEPRTTREDDLADVGEYFLTNASAVSIIRYDKRDARKFRDMCIRAGYPAQIDDNNNCYVWVYPPEDDELESEPEPEPQIAKPRPNRVITAPKLAMPRNVPMGRAPTLPNSGVKAANVIIPNQSGIEHSGEWG